MAMNSIKVLLYTVVLYFSKSSTSITFHYFRCCRSLRSRTICLFL